MTEKTEGGALEHAVYKLKDMAGGLKGQAEASQVSQAEDFAREVALSDLYEIEAGKIALERARSPALLVMADEMIVDHTESLLKLRGRLSPEQVRTCPMEPDDRRKDMLKHLREAAPERFDQTYLDQQRIAHREVNTLMQTFRDNGDDSKLREFAGDMAPRIEKHLKMFKELSVE